MAMTFVHLGYALMVFTLLLMLWISSSGAESLLQDCQPCAFNPVCSCTKSYDSLGEVHCVDVYFPRVPPAINRSRLSTLHLRNNDLASIEPYFLVNTGLYKITIQDNPLTYLNDDSLYGLDRSLWELELINTHLTYVPSRAIRTLRKLKILNLSGNQISEVKMGDWNGLENSLKTLKLANNALTSLPFRTFDGLESLENLDLSGNMISEIHVNAFEDGPLVLHRLNLADNMLKFIPFVHLSSSAMKSLKYLDVSYNLIESTKGPLLTMASRGGKRNKFILDELHLEYNNIKILEPQSLQNFEAINKTYFDGNPITHIQDGAFQSTKIRELYLVDCNIYNVSNDAFKGLETYLRTLDVSNNNITEFPVQKLQQNFNYLFKLALRDNKIKHLFSIHHEAPENVIKSNDKKILKGKSMDHDENYRKNLREINNHHEFNSLQDFDFSGWKNGPLQMNNINGFKYLRRLSLSKLTTTSLESEMFMNFTIDMEELQITGSDLKTIKAHAFKHIHSLKYLDLSDNMINLLDSEAFKEIGHSLQYLKMSHAFASTFKPIPGDAFRYLSELKYMELSNNHLQYLRESTFHFQTNLRTLKLQDCMIETLHKGTFQTESHSLLEEIYLSFNMLKKIEQGSFDDLPSLGKIHLEENRINIIEKHAFTNLERLRWLILRGNQIEKLDVEAFQNLPYLLELDLAYNNIKNIDFTFLDQVGMLSNFRMNVSHNLLSKLSSSSNFSMKGLQSNIKVLDISYNSIKDIEDNFFSPMDASLGYLHMSHNNLGQVSRNVFGNLNNLIWVDLGYNRINEVGFDSFRGSKKLQVFIMSHNRLVDLTYNSDLFKGCTELRIVDFSFNKIRVLPDMFFTEDSMEVLKMAHNELSRMPVLSFSAQSAGALCDMDLSHNTITTLPVFEMFSRFKSLKRLNLAGNRLVHLEDSNFAGLIHLTYLDLSHNGALIFENRGRMFLGLEQSLQHLKLKNISLTSIPELPLPSLLSLDLSRNQIESATSDRASNLSLLRHLDLSHNQLMGFPSIIMNLPELNNLNVANNRIYDIYNSTFTVGVQKLMSLDLSLLPLGSFETGALNKMISLQTLVISTFTGIKDFNIPSIISDINSLRNLNLKVEKLSRMGKEFNGFFPHKLRNITISGKALHAITTNNIFQGLRYPNLNLTIFNTSLETMSDDIFRHMGSVRNISLDIRNNSLKSYGNPSTYALPKQHGQTFLTSLKVSGNPWTCDCSIGWMEVWHRKKRQFLCNQEDSSPSSSNRFKDVEHYTTGKSTCFVSDEDLEMASCADKKKSLAAAFKNDIECGWGAASRCHGHLTYFIMVVVMGLYYVIV